MWKRIEAKIAERKHVNKIAATSPITKRIDT